MLTASTVEPLGQYCGRFHPGFFGEPQNSFSNVAFILGALWAFLLWRRQAHRDVWQLPLFALAALMGVGSLVFHSHPTPLTLTGDLVPIQVFGLEAIGYICRRHLQLTPVRTAAFLFAFFAIRQLWVRSLPFVMGGGITHVPAVMVLLGMGVVLKRRGDALANYLFAASVCYVAALAVRMLDLPLCSTFPVGLHWAWHLLTAATAGTIIWGIAANSHGNHSRPDNQGEQSNKVLNQTNADPGIS